MTRPENEGFAEWALVELMGHRRVAGHVTEQQIAGAGFLRIDVPGEGDQAAVTQLYAPAAVYAITPIAEELARKLAVTLRPEPVTRWDLPQLPVKADPCANVRTGPPRDPADLDDDADDIVL
jgi:hypothetical protein